jgi:hypothetical protein
VRAAERDGKHLVWSRGKHGGEKGDR